MMHQHHATWYKGSIPLLVFRIFFLSLHHTAIEYQPTLQHSQPAFLLSPLFLFAFVSPSSYHTLFPPKGKLQQSSYNPTNSLSSKP